MKKFKTREKRNQIRRRNKRRNNESGRPVGVIKVTGATPSKYGGRPWYEDSIELLFTVYLDKVNKLGVYPLFDPSDSGIRNVDYVAVKQEDARLIVKYPFKY